MKKWLLLVVLSALCLPLKSEAIRLKPGLQFISVSIAMFVQDESDCFWNYSPEVPQSGPVLIRGRKRIFTVVEVREDCVLATDDPMFGQTMKVVCIRNEDLENEKAFSFLDTNSGK